MHRNSCMRKYITIGAIVAALLLVSSIAVVSDVEAKKSKKNYRAVVDISVDSDCWTKATLKLKDGKGKTLATATDRIDPESDEANDLWFTKTLKFDGSKFKGDKLKLSVHFNTESDDTYFYDTRFFKNTRYYEFTDNDVQLNCEREWGSD